MNFPASFFDLKFIFYLTEIQILTKKGLKRTFQGVS